MLQLSGFLIGKPVLSLRTGSPVAWVASPIFNPRNLKIEGFYVNDSIDSQQLVLMYQDIRETSAQGFIVDDHDVLAQTDDLVRLHEVMDLAFDLLKKPVETVSKVQVGKVSDYAVETTTMFVQKLYVTQSIWKNLTGGSLSVDRWDPLESTCRHASLSIL